MKKIIDVVKYKRCTGCGACANICPQDAISMVSNNEGFLIPKIDNKKCNNCGLCNRACPILNEVSNEFQYLLPKVYAGWNKNEKIRMKSSSGGVFSVLAEYFLKKKGYVCGAAFDKKNHLRHIIISNKKDLSKLRGSKYVQSDIGNVLRDVKKLLDNDNWVLFSGVPCQVAGLKSFLRKDYKKLLVVDLVCHGVPSPKVFKKYINAIEKKNACKINQINFRDKSTGWKDYSFLLSDSKKNILKCKHNDDLYFKGFLENLFLNKICTSCPFSKFPKCSNITLGDYWGIWDYKKNLDDDKGVSVLIVNNQKGLNFLESINNTKKIFLKKVSKDEILRKIFSIYLPCCAHQNREGFFENIGDEKVLEKINKKLNYNVDFDVKNVAILNMRFPTNNYGAILQSFALSEKIKNMGYKPKVINYISKELDNDRDKISLLSLDKFREEKIEYTLPCYSVEDLINLNKNFNTFVVGSDQVWNYNYLNWAYKDDIGRYFLNFVLPSKNIFSYAASMAENHWNGNNEEVEIVKNQLQKYSYVSVREKSGVGICNNLFDFKAECVLDPTLLLEESDYQKLIDLENIKQNDNKYLAYFTLDKNLEENIYKDEAIKQYVGINKLHLKNVRGEVKKVLGLDKFIYNSIPSWLNYIKNSEFIITDSYHCVIFAILFKKQFLIIEREYAGSERLNSLLGILKIKNRFFPSLDSIKFNDLLISRINYKDVYKILGKERKMSLAFLKNSLMNKKDIDQVVPFLEEELLEQKMSKINLQTKTQEIELQNQNLKTKTQEIELQNQNLQAKVNELEISLNAYLNTKTYKYTKKLKNYY